MPVHDDISSLLMREILCHGVAESFSFAGLSAANEKDQFLCDLSVSSDPDQSGERAVNYHFPLHSRGHVRFKFNLALKRSLSQSLSSS